MGVLARAYFGLVGIVGLATGAVLLLAPGSTADYFTWAIAPPQTAAFMGAGYLGTGLTLLGGLVLARSWGEIRLIVPPIGIFAASMIAATLLHTDRFFWERPVSWIWLGLYLLIILGGAGVAVAEARRGVLPEPSVPLTRAEQLGLFVAGALTAGWAIPLFVVPDLASILWPWPLSGLTARVVAGWIGVAAALAVLGSISHDARSIRVPLIGWTGTVALFVISAAGNLPAFRFDDPRTLLYFGALVGSILASTWFLLRIHGRLG